MTFSANMDQFVKSEREYLSLRSLLLKVVHFLYQKLFFCHSAYFTSYCFSEGTRLKQEGQPMLSMKTYLMPRMPVTICQALMCATATWWSFTTMQTEYVWQKL